MRPLMFATILGVLPAPLLRAQDVPGRDLLDFPVATMAEAPVLATHFGGGLWNPAASALQPGTRARFGAATLRTPADQAVAVHVAFAEASLGSATTLGVSLVRASVGDLLRTESDPRSIGGEIPYSATVISATASRRYEGISGGLSVRHRLGELDATRRQATGIDAGILAERVLGRDVRLAASTFLWRPAHEAEDRPRYSVGAEARLMGPDSLRGTWAGYAYATSGDLGDDHYLFLSTRYGPLLARAGLASESAFGHRTWRPRLGLGLQHARWNVGFAREESGAGLGPTYQFMLSSVIR